jgi:hypothetical protein
MATTHASGTGVAPDRSRHGRQAAIGAAVALAVVAILAVAVLFGLRDVGDKDAQASPATHPTASAPSAAPASPIPDDPGAHADVGPRGDLPALLPAAPTRSAVARVRLGDVTDGVLRWTPDRTWQVRVRWNGRLQPVATRGPARLDASSTVQRSTSWVSEEGLLYTRVRTGSPHRFRVYAWEPRGGTAYTPPTLVATDLGQVCFDPSFTAFGNCRTGG